MNPISIIGRERALIDKLAASLAKAANREHEVTRIREDPRGSHFEVRILVDDEYTGRVARVSVELESED